MTLKIIFLNFFLLLSLISCSSPEKRTTNTPSLNQPYRTSGVEQYFLPELPGWANSSESGGCFKSNSFQYLDFAKVNANYQLTYSEIVELQAQYNKRREDYFRSTAYRFLKPVEEASFFNNTLQEVRGGVRLLQLPEVPVVDLIWLESFLQDEKGLQILTQMNASGKFDERPVILFSSCLSHMRLNQWVMESGLENVGFFLLSAEWLTPYSSDFTLKTGMKIELDKIIGHKTVINIIQPNKRHKISVNEISY
ncbi:MAG TPA: hypothetical protein VKY27_01800 [Bacteriovoracaceae bacterium]|nr:hypothetical protein [Bacteriovoracaceae bacterium]